MITVAGRFDIVPLRLPGDQYVGPLGETVVDIRENVLTAVVNAVVHSEIPAVPFARGIAIIGITLENHPTGASRSTDPAIVDRTLTALLIPTRPEPGLESEWNASVRIIFCFERNC